MTLPPHNSFTNVSLVYPDLKMIKQSKNLVKRGSQLYDRLEDNIRNGSGALECGHGAMNKHQLLILPGSTSGMQKHITKPCSCTVFVSRHTSRRLQEIKGRRKPSSLLNLASIMPYRKRKNPDDEGTKKLLAADRKLDELNEKTDEDDDILQRWWLHMQ